MIEFTKLINKLLLLHINNKINADNTEAINLASELINNLKQYCDVKYSKTKCPIILEGSHNDIADYFWNNYFYYFKSQYELYVENVYQVLQQLRETLTNRI